MVCILWEMHLIVRYHWNPKYHFVRMISLEAGHKDRDVGMTWKLSLDRMRIEKAGPSYIEQFAIRTNSLESGHKEGCVGDDWKSGGAWDGMGKMGKPHQLSCNCDITYSPAGPYVLETFKLYIFHDFSFFVHLICSMCFLLYLVC